MLYEVIKNDEKASKSLIIRIRGNIISLHPLTIKLINTREMVLEKDHGFVKVFNTFDEIDNSHHKLQMHNHRTTAMINRKNEMLEYLEIIRSRLIDM